MELILVTVMLFAPTQLAVFGVSVSLVMQGMASFVKVYISMEIMIL